MEKPCNQAAEAQAERPPSKVDMLRGAETEHLKRASRGEENITGSYWWAINWLMAIGHAREPWTPPKILLNMTYIDQSLVKGKCSINIRRCEPPKGGCLMLTEIQMHLRAAVLRMESRYMGGERTRLF
jgi:hypothetical protein